MDLTRDSDQEFFQDTTHKFLEASAGVSVLRDLRHDADGFDRAYWRQGSELGWTSLLVSEEDGGGSISGRAMGDLSLVAHEFGRHASPGPLAAVNVVASALSRNGNDEQKAVLGEILAGDVIASWAHAEPRPNNGLGVVTAEATKSGDGYTLTGVKTPVEHGAQAQQLLVSARSDGGITQFLVPTDANGVTVTPLNVLDQTRRYAQVSFDGVSLPATAVVGTAGAADDELEHQLQIALAIQAAESVGALDRALEITIEYAFDRYTFGRPLASYQELKHRFADMKMWLEASHGIADAAANAYDAGAPDTGELVSVAKSYIGEYGPELCHDCIQIHGGIGVTYEHDMHLFLRRVVTNRNLYGDVAQHRERLTSMLEAKEAAAR